MGAVYRGLERIHPTSCFQRRRQCRWGRAPVALAGAGFLFSGPLSPGPQNPSPGEGPYHDHLGRDGEADPVHVASIELLHQHQEDTTDECEDEGGDVGVGEVFADVDEGLGERASCSWAPTPSSHTIPTLHV